jgi:hypothetical protein
MNPLMFQGGPDFPVLLIAVVMTLVYGLPWLIVTLSRQTRGWLMTRGLILVGIASTVFVFVSPNFTSSGLGVGSLSVVTWLTAMVLSTVGTAWMVRIAASMPDEEPKHWRFRR